MATINILILALCVICAHAIPQTPLKPRTTIFGDERLEGGIFEHVDAFYTDANLRNTEAEAFRLPTTTRPIHYNVLWGIDISRLAFSGTVEIELAATQSGVSEIVIHADDMQILSVELRQAATVIPQTFVLQSEHQFMRVQLTSGTLLYNSLTPIVYTLTISFAADLRDDMYGIYKSWFRNNNNDTESWMATTQFQATAARYAFPCYDEPSFKAVFDITIRRPTTHKSWSCTRISETRTSLVVGYEEDVYYPTPVMSTYLLALIVAEYDSLTVYQNNTLIYEVIARPAALASNQGQYSFEVGQELLAEMNNHTDMNFYSVHPYIKMTQASIPDFGAGAMENWGLLTYREAYLMYDPDHTNDYFKQLIAYILSHEIAHMWFGNLVTCDWWDVLWLNEGFARYYQYFLTHWVEDYMGLDTRFIIEQVHTSLLSDSANNPHALSNPGVGSPASVSAMFSTISYNKGAAVIRMTEHLLGFNVHRQGLRSYLVNRAFDTALPIHLFQELQNVAVSTGAIAEYGADFSVIDYYRMWTDLPGHPVLNVQINHQTGDMIITQRRFNINTGYSTVNTNWIVPITFATASNPDFANTKPSHIIRDTVSVINRGTTGDEWVIFNKQQTGFYRINYDDYSWNLIIMALRGSDRTLIHEYNRAQIVNDVFQFARSGIMTYTRALNILSFLEFERDYAPWLAALTGFSWIRNRFAGTTMLAEIESEIIKWATPVMNDLTYYPVAGETFMRSYLRYQLAPVMCAMNVPACRAAALAQFRALADTGVEVPVNSRNWVYCNGLRDGTTADFDFLWNRFLQHNVYTEKIQLLMVLGCTPHVVSLNTFMNAIVQENYIIRPQDYTTAFNSAVTGNEGNTQIAFQFIQNNLQTVTNAFGSPTTPLSYVSSRLRTVEEITAFQTWATQNQAALGNSYQQVFNGAESSRESIQWAAAVQNDINNYLITGNELISVTTTTAAPVIVPDISPAPPLEEPANPVIPASPDSATTTAVSAFAVMFALVAKFVA